MAETEKKMLISRKGTPYPAPNPPRRTLESIAVAGRVLQEAIGNAEKKRAKAEAKKTRKAKGA